ncbi:MAG: NUDIX hydrolase [Ktedonobacterales bacterium]
MPRLPVVHAFSAGGVVFRYSRPENTPRAPQAMLLPASGPQAAEASLSGPQVILVGRAADDFWVLPKGTPERGETNEQVALREVSEETGVQTRIVGQLGSIRYGFSRQGRRYSKEVLYYLMEAIGGDTSLHDHEYDDAQWFALDAAAEHLAYANEADILRRAMPTIVARIENQTSTG